LRDGSTVVADGAHPESGPMAIVGGTGRFRAATGELSDVIIGTNATGCPNLRVTITLQPPSPARCLGDTIRVAQRRCNSLTWARFPRQPISRRVRAQFLEAWATIA